MSAPITTGIGPAVLTTVISRAIAPLAATSAPKKTVVAQAAILDHVLMMSSWMRAQKASAEAALWAGS